MVGISTVTKGHTSRRPGVAVGHGGKIDTLLRFNDKRTVVFSFTDTAGSAKAKLRITSTRR